MLSDDPFADLTAPSDAPHYGPPPGWDADNPLYGEPISNEPRPPLTLIDPATWQGTTAPTRSWKVKDYIPDRQATLLTGKGAAGKSLLSQIKCTCIAAGLPFLGLETAQANALYITCEDDPDELHRRQDAICAALGITLESLSGKLFLRSLMGEMGNELATFATDGRMSVAPRFTDIVDACALHEISYVTLDNTAHLFTGNENDRHQVASFINLCNRLAVEIEGAVVIVGHPNKAGDSYSGSTAWENQVRSRLFMEIPTNDDGEPDDPDMRVLRREKVNYAQRGGELRFRWFDGTFVLPDDVPENRRYETGDNAKAFHDNDLFMACLATSTGQRRTVSHVNGINYAPRIFAHMPQGKGLKETDFRAAMERLISLGKILLDQPLWRGPNRVMKQGIIAAPTPGDVHEPPSENGGNACTDPAPTPCTDPHEPPSQVIDKYAPTLHCTNPPYTTYMEGEPLGGLSPSLDEPPAWHRDAPVDDEPFEAGDWRENPLLNPEAKL